MRLEELFRRARKRGFRIERTKRGHWKVFPPDPSKRPFTVSPHDWSMKKTLAQFRQAGLDDDGGN